MIETIAKILTDYTSVKLVCITFYRIPRERQPLPMVPVQPDQGIPRLDGQVGGQEEHAASGQGVGQEPQGGFLPRYWHPERGQSLPANQKG